MNKHRVQALLDSAFHLLPSSSAVCDHFCKQLGIKIPLILCFSARKALGLLSTHGFSSPWGKGRSGFEKQSSVSVVSYPRPILGLLWSPCEPPALPEPVLLPPSSVIPWHSQGHGSSRSTRTLPDGLWESRTPQGVLYSSTRLFTKWETQQLEPMKQLLAYWGKTHGLWWWCLLIICAVVPRGGSVLPLGLAVFALSHSVDARR